MLDASFAVADTSFGPGTQTDPVSYASATPAQRPSTRIYRWCSGDSDSRQTSFRLTAVIYQVGYGWRGDARACPFGKWIEAGSQVLKVDDVTLRICSAVDSEHHAVLGRIVHGPMAAFGASGQSFRRADAPTPEVAARDEARSA